MRKLVVAMAVLAIFGLSSCGKKMQTTQNGINYRIIESSDTARLITKGDLMMIQMVGIAPMADSLGGKDTSIFDSYKIGKAYYIPADETTLKDVFMMLHKGDSAEFEVSADTLFMKSFGQLTPGFLKKNSLIHFYVKVENIYNQNELEAMKAEERAKSIMKDSVEATAYLANLTNVQTTASGLKYVITKPSNGAKPKAGQEVSMLYRGLLLNGTKFDENQDQANPFKFTIGMRQVIPGWDEGVMLLHEGEEAKFIIPSRLAYGEQGGGPIPPNSTLIFDVKLLKINPAPAKPAT
ncbi:MAG: FKBP-type peptidyl-prolyl cis-trans isomerase, partial [Bacteroidia bacterium]|nr:FKBP-type peptidyl-prolyl cis-trans isomerase [Bacteroidia bacterium]